MDLALSRRLHIEEESDNECDCKDQSYGTTIQNDLLLPSQKILADRCIRSSTKQHSPLAQQILSDRMFKSLQNAKLNSRTNDVIPSQFSLPTETPLASPADLPEGKSIPPRPRKYAFFAQKSFTDSESSSELDSCSKGSSATTVKLDAIRGRERSGASESSPECSKRFPGSSNEYSNETYANQTQYSLPENCNRVPDTCPTNCSPTKRKNRLGNVKGKVQDGGSNRKEWWFSKETGFLLLIQALLLIVFTLNVRYELLVYRIMDSKSDKVYINGYMMMLFFSVRNLKFKSLLRYFNCIELVYFFKIPSFRFSGQGKLRYHSFEQCKAFQFYCQLIK